MSGTFGDACRFQAGVETVHAEITFNCLAVVRILNRNLPWTGALAGHAADAGLLVDIDNTVVTFAHCSRRADRQAEGGVTVTTGAEGELHSRNSTDLFQRGGADFAQKRTNRQIFIGFTMNLAAVAADASAGIEVDHIVFHSSTLLLGLRILLRT